MRPSISIRALHDVIGVTGYARTKRLHQVACVHLAFHESQAEQCGPLPRHGGLNRVALIGEAKLCG